MLPCNRCRHLSAHLLILTALNINLKWLRQPSEIVSVGEEVRSKLLDRENEISLSLKRMTSDPWENIDIGAKVNGVVVNIVYGAFVQLEEGIVGLLPVSEMVGNA